VGLLDVFRSRGVTALAASAAPGPPPSLTAAAAPPKGPQAQFLRRPDKWQNEVWGFYDTLGEFNYGVWWLANMLSRVRLRAARLQPDVDEPDIVDKGPAAELMKNFGGGVTGQAQIMKRLTVQLSIPGEGYLVGEAENKAEKWMVRSVDEIRTQGRGYQVMNEEGVTSGQEWRDLAAENLVIRVWRPHDRYYHLADSPARSAREIMRELELVNRKILAEYLSRIASAGVLAFPDELSFPVREEFADAENPMMAEWIELASEAIKKPGTASAVVPLPVTGPADYLKEIRFIDLTIESDQHIISKRDSAIKRLATKLDMPAEILLGMGDVNHWGAWQLEEGALKTHVAPLAELICDSLTTGYLQPRLAASGEDPTGWVVWYDMSELALRPDRSENAATAYDRMELSAAAFRREVGFDEDDAPTDDELEKIGLKLLVRTVPNAAPAALDKLLGHTVLDVTAASPAASGGTGPPGPENAAQETPPPGQTPKTPPPTQNAPPPPPGKEAARAERRAAQARTQHVLRLTPQGLDMMHPRVCAEHEWTCPYTQASFSFGAAVRPGAYGTYLCHLDPFGRLQVDGREPYADTRELTSTPVKVHPRERAALVVNGRG
jgi:hypothetical protein